MLEKVSYQRIMNKARNEILRKPAWNMSMLLRNPKRYYSRYNGIMEFWEHYREFWDDDISGRDYILLEFFLSDETI